MFPDHDPVDMLTAFNMLTDQSGEAIYEAKKDPEAITEMTEEDWEAYHKRHAGEKPPLGMYDVHPDKDDPLLKPPVDIRDVPDKPTDAWVDRTIHMVCGTCMNYQEKGRDHRGKLIGACKDDSPTIKGYPRVFDDEPGCGAHKLRVYPK